MIERRRKPTPTGSMRRQPLVRAQAAAALAIASVLVGAPAARGAEFQINTYTLDHQTGPLVAMNGQGELVVVWSSNGQDGNYYGVFARRFAAGGVPIADEFQVNVTATGGQGASAAAISDNGAFVVVWTGETSDGNGTGVVARSFDATGAAQGGEFQVNTYTSGLQRLSSVAMDADGDFVIVWSSAVQDGYGAGVFGQRFDSGGGRLGLEFQVATYTAASQDLPAVAMHDGGAFVVVWQEVPSSRDGDSGGVFGRRFNAMGVALGSDFQVNAHTVSAQSAPAVAIDDSGEVVVVWSSYLQDGSSHGIFARRFAASGAALAVEFQVNAYTSDLQGNPTVGRGGDGRFIVAWESEGQDGSTLGIFTRLYDGGGAPIGGEIRLNTHTSGRQSGAAAAMADDGAFVVAWDSRQDDDGSYGVFAARAGALATLDVDGDGTVAALTDGLLVLRFLFGFTGSTLTNGAVDPDCLRCDAAAILPYLAIGLPVPAGELQVNLHTASQQAFPAIAMDADRDFVVVWAGDGDQDGDQSGVFARRFASSGTAVGAEFRVNDYTLDNQFQSAVAMTNAGDFVIAWASSTQDAGGYGVFAQRFDATGAPLGAELKVNTYTPGLQRVPAAAMDADGDFVIVWNSASQDGYFAGIFGQRFGSSGAPEGTEFQVATYTAGQESGQAVAMHAGGGFVVVWDGSGGRDGDGGAVLGRRFNAAGLASGPDFVVNAYTLGFQSSPSITFDDDAEFVVAWQSYAPDGEGAGVVARRFDAAGTPLAVELQVNSYTLGNQTNPAVARTGGSFAVVWNSAEQDGSALGIFSRRFNAGGTPVGVEVQINAFTAGEQRDAAVAGGGGDFVVAWTSNQQDGDGFGVFTRRLAKPATLDVDADGAASPLTDGLLILRYLFGFSGPTLTNGAVGPACQRCTAPEIESYLQDLL